jgi:hypothetical protein
MQLLKLHLWFCGAILGLGTLSPAAARLLAAAVSPISKIVFSIYPTYHLQLTGPLGRDFYQVVIGETFFMAVVIWLLYQTVYIARYWRCPWRFNEFYMEQLGVRRNVVSAAITAAIATPIAVLFGAILCHWFGSTASEPGEALVKPFQLALWCVMMPPMALTLVLAISMALSAAAAAIRRLFLCGVESGWY